MVEETEGLDNNKEAAATEWNCELGESVPQNPRKRFHRELDNWVQDDIEGDADDPSQATGNEDNDEDVMMINGPEQEQLKMIEVTEDEAERVKSTGRPVSNHKFAGVRCGERLGGETQGTTTISS